MQHYPFIFSDERRYRLRRHFAFWSLWWLFQGFLYSFSAGIFNVPYLHRLPLSLLEAFFFLVPHMFLSYSLMYLVVPRLLLKGRYVATVAAVLVLFVLTGVISSFIGVNVVTAVRRAFYPGNLPYHANEVHFFLGLLAGLRGSITIGGVAAAIKLMKHLYQKEQRNLQLQKESISSQLEILKAQVHPHFLFNTLNNIYASVQVTAPGAGRMIMSLSELLRYMLYECDKPLVRLDKELTMLQQYISLEQARYGEALDIAVTLPLEKASEYYIAPLMLLPFVENCFKHGTSRVIEQPWIQLTVSIGEDRLHMKLMNGKPEGEAPSSKGIGLNNVRKRMELLYPGDHSLEITSEADVFVVNLKLPLEKRRIITKPVVNTSVVYA